MSLKGIYYYVFSSNGDSSASPGMPRSWTRSTTITTPTFEVDAERGLTSRLSRFPRFPVLHRPNFTIDEEDVASSSRFPSRGFPRTTTTSTAISSTLTNAPKNWWTRLKEFINPNMEEDDAYIPNFRATPMVAALMIPFSILLEIPGLTEKWYIVTEDNKIVETRDNPVILDIGLAISMTSALIANISLVTRFLERKVKTATIIAIIFLSIHDIINIIAVTVFGVVHRFNDGFTYGQSFWVTVCSTIASTATNVILITDLIRTPDFSRSGSGLTRKQRTLIIIVMIMLCYIAIGSLVNGVLMKLSFIDGLYFTVCSIETIGFGDIVPASTGARVFVCGYSALGIVNLGLAVGSARDTVLEALEQGYRNRIREVRRRRRDARKRRKIEQKWHDTVAQLLRDVDKPVWLRQKSSVRQGWGAWLWSWVAADVHPGGFSYGPHNRRLNLEALSADQLERAALSTGVPLQILLPSDFVLERNGATPLGHVSGTHTHQRIVRMAGLLTRFAFAHGVGTSQIDVQSQDQSTLGRDNSTVTEKGKSIQDEKVSIKENERAVSQAESDDVPDRRVLDERAFNAFLNGVEELERKAFYTKLFVAWTLFALFWFIGGVIFMVTEKWSYGVSLYFCFIAFTSIGYGDFSPKTPAGRSVFVGWALLGVGTMTILISVLSDAYSSRYNRALQNGAFDKAVGRYRERTRGRSRKRDPSRAQSTDSARAQSASPGRPSMREVRASTQHHLESLPATVLTHAQAFHDSMQYFMGGGDAKDIPPALQKLIDEIALSTRSRSGSSAEGGHSESEGAKAPDYPNRMGKRLRREMMNDQASRHTLFTLSLETAIRKIVEAAEDAKESMKERDNFEEQLKFNARDGDDGAEGSRPTSPFSILGADELTQEPEEIEPARSSRASFRRHLTISSRGAGVSFSSLPRVSTFSG